MQSRKVDRIDRQIKKALPSLRLDPPRGRVVKCVISGSEMRRSKNMAAEAWTPTGDSVGTTEQQ